MKQSAVEWIISKLPMVNDNDPYLAELIEQAKEMEKEQSDNLAIGFGACLIELLNDSETKTETMKELLEIYKKK